MEREILVAKENKDTAKYMKKHFSDETFLLYIIRLFILIKTNFQHRLFPHMNCHIKMLQPHAKNTLNICTLYFILHEN